MRIAIFHNYYTQPGGEDVVYELECETFETLGHTVFPFSVRNTEVFSKASLLDKARIGWSATGSKRSYERVKRFLELSKPDVSHIHNWFPVLSPSIYKAHKDLGIPVVQTLHNYRLGCANGTNRLKDEACARCSSGHNWSAVRNRCYRGSLMGTLAWKRMVDFGWSKNVFTEDVGRYVSPSLEVARRHVDLGIPEDRITVVPNACGDLQSSFSAKASPESPRGAVFVGRMVPEKGVDTLIEAWRLLDGSDVRSEEDVLSLIGDGPGLEANAKALRDCPSIRATGQLEHASAMERIQSSSMLIFPSRWAEPFGLGVIEAMALGKPVIATNIGGPSEIVEDGVTGILIPKDDPRALADSIAELLADPDKARRMGEAGRKKYLKRYTPETQADALMGVFQSLAG